MRKIIISLVLASSPCAEAASTYSASTASSLSSGRYGGTEPTRVASTSLSLRSEIAGWHVGATLPHLTIEAPAGGLFAPGLLVEAGATSKRQSGYGDVQLRLERSLAIRRWAPVDARIVGQLKAPTGARGLSTGKMDGGVSLELSRQLGSVTPYVSVGYRFFGDRDLLRLKDGWATSLGATVTRGRTMFLLSYERSDPVVPGPAPREILGLASLAVTPQWNVSLYGSKGLSRSTSSKMFGLAITRIISR